jgi:exodeoxyribonuclease III
MSILRLMSWNIENLPPALGITASPARGPARLDATGKAGSCISRARAHLYEIMTQFGWPDMLCLQEVRIRPSDQTAIARMKSALPGYVCQYALASDPQNAKFRGGRAYGVAIYLRDHLPAIWLPPPAWDREGRVLGVLLPELSLCVINVYAVNGSDKPHFDHQSGQFSGDRHAFKRRFQADLIAYVRHVCSDNQLVLIGDWNVSRTALDTWPRLRTENPHAQARAMFNETLMPALAVEDVFRTLHPERRAYTWFNRLARPGKLDAARVDFALVSRSLLGQVERAAIYEEPTQRFHSDHAPIELVLRV